MQKLEKREKIATPDTVATRFNLLGKLLVQTYEAREFFQLTGEETRMFPWYTTASLGRHILYLHARAQSSANISVPKELFSYLHETYKTGHKASPGPNETYREYSKALSGAADVFVTSLFPDRYEPYHAPSLAQLVSTWKFIKDASFINLMHPSVNFERQLGDVALDPERAIVLMDHDQSRVQFAASKIKRYRNWREQPFEPMASR